MQWWDGDLSPFAVAIALIVIYKVVDVLLRRPRVGLYGDRCVLVTGCGQGIGYETVRRLDRLGCRCVFAGCRRAESVLELRNAFSERVHPFQMDIADRDSVRKAFEYVSSKLPPNKGLWGLVNNAAMTIVLPPRLFGVENYERTLAVNLIGTIDVTLAFLPLVERERGRIVNVSSAAGRFAFPSILPYSVSKFALEAFSDGLRRSLGPRGCKVLIIESGAVKTSFFSSERILKCYDDAAQKIQTQNSTDDHQTPEDEEEKCSANKDRVNLRRTSEHFGMFSSMDDVTSAYLHALFAVFPRPRYVVGMDAKLTKFISLLPEWVGDLWVRKMSFLL